MAVAMFIFSSNAMAWDYETEYYSYQDNGQLNGTCPDGICVKKAAKITNDSDSSETLSLLLHYGERIGNFQWGERRSDGKMLWHEIPMSSNKWSKKLSSGNTIYFRVVLRKQHPTSYQWLIYRISSTPAVSHIFAKDGGGVYYIFPPDAHYYNHDFEKDLYGYVMIIENSIPE